MKSEKISARQAAQYEDLQIMNAYAAEQAARQKINALPPHLEEVVADLVAYGMAPSKRSGNPTGAVPEPAETPTPRALDYPPLLSAAEAADGPLPLEGVTTGETTADAGCDRAGQCRGHRVLVGLDGTMSAPGILDTRRMLALARQRPILLFSPIVLLEMPRTEVVADPERPGGRILQTRTDRMLKLLAARTGDRARRDLADTGLQASGWTRSIVCWLQCHYRLDGTCAPDYGATQVGAKALRLQPAGPEWGQYATDPAFAPMPVVLAHAPAPAA